MKLTDAAIRRRNVQMGHLSMMKDDARVREERPAKRPYSTEGFARPRNGIEIPTVLRERIESAAAPKERVSNPSWLGTGGFPGGFF
jgi:hypothetical protein